MRKNQYLRRVISMLMIAISLAAFSGCSAGREPESAPAEGPSAAQGTNTPSTEAEPAGADGQPAEDGSDRVGSVEELLEAIRPQAGIILEPGYYNLTDFLSDFPDPRDYDLWNEEHKYVDIIDTFDGLEIVIRNANGLSIEGGSEDPADTELVTEPRYAAVLNFSNCRDIELACLTLGHTDTGDCSGNVLDFDNCRDIRLRTLDLYGCGVYGIGCHDFCADLSVSNSTIRDCEFGPFEIYNGVGDFTFTACTLSGSGGGGIFEFNDSSRLSFAGCFFGQEESNTWYWDEDALFDDCEFTEPDVYPDFGYEDYIPVFDPEDMEQLRLTPDRSINDTFWLGYAVVDPQSGDTQYLINSRRPDAQAEYAWLTVENDGSGRLEYRDKIMDFERSSTDSEYICLEGAEQNLYVTLYLNSDSDVWLLMQYNNDLIWFY